MKILMAVIVDQMIEFIFDCRENNMRIRSMSLHQNCVFVYPITAQCYILTHQRYIAVENNVRKGEIACNEQLLLFSQCFPPKWHLFFILNAFQNVVCNCLSLDQSKILSSGNGLKDFIYKTVQKFKQAII